MKWKTVNEKLWIYEQQNNTSRSRKCCIFDLDGTIIQSRLSIVKKSWKYLFPYTKEFIQTQARNGYDIFILSNQTTITTDTLMIVESILHDIGISLTCFIAKSGGPFAKPLTTVWDQFVNNSGHRYVAHESFMFGDSNGDLQWRHANKGDLYFAINTGLQFHDPNFRTMPLVDQTSWYYRDAKPSFELGRMPDFDLPRDQQHIVIMTGPPASGKSTYIEKHLKNYVSVCQDDLKTITKCKKVAKSLLETKKNIVIDATNRDVPTRKQWIDLANQYQLPIYSIVLDYPKKLALHLNAYRMLTAGRHVPTIAISVYFKNYKKPSTEEGFSEVYEIDSFVNENPDPLLSTHLVG
jgi:bifunctional polynucleotide phosphatase/kinase